MKAIFWGYHKSGDITLKELIKNKVNVLAVMLPHDRDTSSTEVIATDKDIAIFKPKTLKHNYMTMNFIEFFKPDIFIVDSYDKLIPQEYLDIPKMGCFNFHEALLPKYRGQHIMNWALINGEKESGLTVHAMTGKFDEGDIAIQKKVKITDKDDINSLYDKICKLIPAAVKELIGKLRAGKLKLRKQDESKASYFRKRTPEDGLIDWNKSAKEIYNLIRALKKPWPNAFGYIGDEKILINNAILYHKKIKDFPFATNDNKLYAKSLTGKAIYLKGKKNPFIICGDGGIIEITEFGVKED